MYKTYDLDDFIESGNNMQVKTLEIKVFNVNTTGNIEFTGEIIGGMIAVNTNNVNGEINIILNEVSIDTDSKKVQAIYVYNKDINHTDAKVTIRTKEDTKNYIEGGKLKKVSLIPSNDLSSYTSNYFDNNKTNYEIYKNYYGIYTESEIENVLFARVKATNENLLDGDPYYFYKASGVVSSDIDLYFEGKGYLEIVSKNKEGIESKGNLTFAGGTGDYVIKAKDDCINTATDSKEVDNARNTLTIDVNSLYAIVSLEAKEGDAIDSNGKLIINGGNIIAVGLPDDSSGIDTTFGPYINGGTVFAIENSIFSRYSDQKFMVFIFKNAIDENNTITLLDEDNNVMFSYKSDRVIHNIFFSSENLKDTNYYLYKNGTIDGVNSNGYYTNVTSYTKGKQFSYPISYSKFNNKFDVNGSYNVFREIDIYTK